jgi:ABC-type multidrug transport system fused ATPase/permease subunit
LLAHAGAEVDAATAVFNPLPFALGVVVMIVANVIFQRRMAPAAMDVQRRRGLVAEVAPESFEAALLVKSLGTADREEATLAEQADMLRAAAVRAGSIRALFDPVVDLLPNLGTLLVLGVGAWRATAGSVTAGDIVTAAYLLTVLAIPVRSFGWVLGDLPRGLVGYQRIAGVVDRPEVLATGSLVLAERAGGLAVRVEGVGLEVTEPRMSSTGSSPLGSSLIGSSPFGSSSSPAALTLLDDITLSIEPGTTVAIVGATGSGKTTLVSLLARLADPTRGRVLFDGTDLRDLATGEVPGVAALVAQSAFVFEDTVRDNITLGGPYCDDDVWAALRRSRLDDVIAALPGGLDAPLGERGANLSGGQRQRLAIARALVRRPRFLILDDATSAVDPRVEGDILRGIGALGATIVMVAYRMSSVARADLVVHLDAGRIADVGTHEELLGRDEGYRRIATAYLQADRLRDEGRQ